MNWETNYQSILEKLENIEPVKYAKTRNYIDGDVTKLSPYISRGVISTKQVLGQVLKTGVDVYSIEKFIQEFAWRDYWQQVWINKGNLIDSDLKSIQQNVQNYQMPKAIVDAKTNIQAIDEAIEVFYKTGYLHNHVRMYIASIACNIGQSHWKVPAQWMYYHLLDADWASNALSWQWVVGANSNKKYYANQQNINKFCYTREWRTFLNVSYDDFDTMGIPKELEEIVDPSLSTSLPSKKEIKVDSSLPTCIYNFYNLDPAWKDKLEANRVLLLEPSVFEKYPVSPHSIEFMLDLANNIKGIQIYIGEFNELIQEYDMRGDIYYKEHPLNGNYRGVEESRDWLFSVKGYYPSFFAFWKKCRKELKQY
ncbi:MAG: deoxyribodipyrimidine photolyase [Cytophagales bacterium]|nr:deoxyribodipyrimidine photolyase [Cytophagales bacterium]